MLKEIQNHIEIEEFGKYKVDLIKEHQYYANKLGLYDMVVDKYNINDALRHIDEKNYNQFLKSCYTFERFTLLIIKFLKFRPFIFLKILHNLTKKDRMKLFH